MTGANSPPIPRDWDRYLATEQAIKRDPITLIEDLRNRQVRRGDGSVGSMTFDEISEILTLLAAQHATEYGITPVVISREAVRRWWRHLRPGQPVRESRGARAKRLGDSVTLAELERTDPQTAAEVRQELGL